MKMQTFTNVTVTSLYFTLIFAIYWWCPSNVNSKLVSNKHIIKQS